MADQAQSQVQSVTDTASEKVDNASLGIASTIEGWGSNIAQWGQDVLDRFISPEKRAEILARIQDFMLANPKLSTFLGMNVALTGIPLGLFILFSLTVAVFALIVGVVVGVLAAVFFTILCVGIALSFVFPIVFFTTLVACFLFLWGLGGYHLLKWINGTDGTEENEAIPLLSSGSIGDSLNSITGGRLASFMDNAKAEKAKDDISGFNDEHTKPQPPPEKAKGNQQTAANDKEKPVSQQPNQSPKSSVGQAVKSSASGAQKATKAAGVDGKVRTATNATSAVKGGIGGASGLG